MMMIIMIPMVAVMVSSFVSLGTMPQQLSVAEQNLINRMVRSERKSPSEAWKALQNSECLWRVLAILLGIIGCKETNMSLQFLHSNKGHHVKK